MRTEDNSRAASNMEDRKEEEEKDEEEEEKNGWEDAFGNWYDSYESYESATMKDDDNDGQEDDSTALTYVYKKG